MWVSLPITSRKIYYNYLLNYSQLYSIIAIVVTVLKMVIVDSRMMGYTGATGTEILKIVWDGNLRYIA